ncbi:hypothetical protein [Granulicoccus sp. GXG6511]|uniref:hypothetical protein n=1 Tax=Granulicoccus sp. GXG6511 TaxID=3381351 RepID=UPI003D7CABFB
MSTAAVLATLVLAGCGTNSTTPAATPEPVPTAAPTSSAGEPPTTPTPTADAEAEATPTDEQESTSLDDAVIESDGVGPIRIGMSLSEARAHGWAARSEVCDKWDASPALIERGLSFTFVDDELYEIWVHKPEFATAEGIKVGDTLTQVKAAYGTRLQTESREGGGGNLPAWFVVEGDHELLFVEEDPGRDERIKSILPRNHGTSVIEGC